MLTSLLSAVRHADDPIERQVFEAWSIEIPSRFTETFVDEESYWHAWTSDRSVSLTSVLLTDRRGRSIPFDELARELDRIDPLPDGERVEEHRPGVIGRYVVADAVQPAVASTVLAGVLGVEGRVLIVTITSDDLEWARRTWTSIRWHPAPLPSRERRRRRGRSKAMR